MNKPLISIITVCLNGEKTIRSTIESILNQTYTNIEYILIDGKSSDRTLEIIHSYEPHFLDKGIVYKSVSESDKGIYDAMNKGVALAQGTLVGVIGSDDWFELNTMELVADHFKKTQADYIHGNIRVYSSSKNFLKVRTAGSKKDMIKEMSFFHPASFIKKSIIVALNGYSTDYAICSDYDLILRIINKNYDIVHLDKILSNVSYGGVSTSEINKALKESHLVRVKNGYNPFFSKLFYYKAFLIQKFKRLTNY